jgi:integrase
MSNYSTKSLKSAVKRAGFIKCPKCETWHYANERHVCEEKYLYKTTEPTKKKKQTLSGPRPTYPIYDIKEIEKIKNYIEVSFPKATRYRNLCFFVWGINTNLRASDLTNLRFEQVGLYPAMLENFTPGYSFEIIESKTKKNRTVYVNQNMAEALAKWLKIRGCSEGILFCSMRGDEEMIAARKDEPLTTDYWKKMFNHLGKKLNIKINLRTLRKCWAYHCWKSGVPIEIVSKALNHYDVKMTYRYLGIKDEDVKAAFMMNI